MADRSGTSPRLVAVLWFVASGLADVAVVIRYMRSGEVAWALVAAGVFALVMGVIALQRSRSAGA